MKFEPESLEINAGDIVEWINKEIVSHDITAIDKAWSSGLLKNWTKVNKDCDKKL